MTTRASGTFDVKLSPRAPDDKVEGSALVRMSIDKQFHGDLEATSKGEMLTAGTSVKGSAGYVAIERVSGKLHGRSGTCVLQHSGTMTRGAPQLSITVVPDSGTGQLAGLTGKMEITITTESICTTANTRSPERLEPGCYSSLAQDFSPATQMRTVLFVCEFNARRSQLAEGVVRALLPPGWRAVSAGLTATGVDHEVIRALGELRVDRASLHSKSLRDVRDLPVDDVFVLAAPASARRSLARESGSGRWRIRCVSPVVGPASRPRCVRRETRFSAGWRPWLADRE